MPFKFCNVCDLLSSLEGIELREPPLLKDQYHVAKRRVVEGWFKQHRRAIDAPDTNGVALLSTLFPERRADRVYGMQAPRLSQTLARCLNLGVEKIKDLNQWKTPGKGDLGACLERILRIHDVEPRIGSITIDDVDSALHELASRCDFSSPEVRAKRPAQDSVKILTPIYLRLRSQEAKWFTRLILKDFSLVVLDEHLVLKNLHFLLPDLLRFQDSFHAAVALLRGPLKRYHSNPDLPSQRLFKEEAAKHIKPQVGTKVGRPTFHKARSIDHCLKMVGNKRWSIERKYDGEYCEIHVDLAKGHDCIRIFSKSGKDSTEDRKGVHDTIRESLRIGQSGCKFKRKCILLGELLVYCDREEKILDFHKIRKHVSRSGRFLGTNQDSQVHDHEHLMIMFFDVLLIDDMAVMALPHFKRRECLKTLLDARVGRAIRAEWTIMDFSKESAKASLVHQFAASVACRHEGLVLKPADAPYFSLADESSNWRNGFIKLKKDYMQQLGDELDVADFAVVGASYDAQQAQRSGVGKLRWTTFHLGCLTNPESIRFGVKPEFKLVGTINHEQCIPTPDLQTLNDLGQSRAEPYDGLCNPTEFNVISTMNSLPRMTVTFKEPFVVEVLGSGFEKPSNQDFFMLRHARIIKSHLDRTWKDAVTFEELNDLAEKARSAPEDGESQETARLVKKLEQKMVRKVSREGTQALSTPMSTPRSNSTASPISARRNPVRQRTTPCPSPLVRMDTADMLPGEDRFASPTEKISRSTCRMTLYKSILTPPSSREPVKVDNPRIKAKRSPEFIPCRDPPARLSKDIQAVQPSTLKRSSDAVTIEGELALSAAKRLKIAVDRHPLSPSRPVTDTAEATPVLRTTTFQSSSRPFADITNRSPQRSPRRSCSGSDGQKKPASIQDDPSSSRPPPRPCRIIPPCPPARRLSHPPLNQLPPLLPGTCVFNHFPTPCPFSNAIAYLSPCIATQAWVVENLIPWHGATLTTSLEHWARENVLVPPLSDVVAESQAYAGMEKVVFVEMGRMEQCWEVVGQVKRLGIRDEVRFWDWRVLEVDFRQPKGRTGREVGVQREEREEGLSSRYYFGMTGWDEQSGAVVFIGPGPSDEDPNS